MWQSDKRNSFSATAWFSAWHRQYFLGNNTMCYSYTGKAILNGRMQPLKHHVDLKAVQTDGF